MIDPPPFNANVITYKWVFKKVDGSGTVEYKGRVVACGYRQLEGVDSEETYAPVIRMGTVRMLFTIAVSPLGWLVDIESAFLHGKPEIPW